MENMSATETREAYRVLTRELTNMHCTERDILDAAPILPVVLSAVHAGRGAAAVVVVEYMRTERGDAWRAKQGKEFSNVK